MPNLEKSANVAYDWEKKEKGLRKKVIEFNFQSMEKPTELSKCYISIVSNAGDDMIESNTTNKSDNFWLQLGTAITPIDMYIELFLLEMFEGEKSECVIQSKSSKELKFVITLHEIKNIKYNFQLTIMEAYNLAKQFKDNGVFLFKKYPKFAHDYFCRSAKLLISYKPFDCIHKISNGVSGKEINQLLQNVQTNIAACSIKLGSYQDVIFLTEFVEKSNEKPEKTIYRRALAYYNLQQFIEAKELIEKSNLCNHKDFSTLYSNILKGLRAQNDNYKNVVKKMFRL